jgi:hypothetical protein
MKLQSLLPVSLLTVSIAPEITGQDPAAPPMVAEVRGGLIVQLGADDAELPCVLARTGRHVAHVLDTSAAAVASVHERILAEGGCGFAFSETIDTFTRLPYTENLVNAVVLRDLEAPWTEILRVLVPGGTLAISQGDSRIEASTLEAAGFETVSRNGEGFLTARKPRPENMDNWSHPRHGANGNPVSADTAVGPPKRIRWVAAAMSEVEGLVTGGGRNFYGGVLARDSFNGLRLWHHDLAKGNLNAPAFDLPRLSPDRALDRQAALGSSPGSHPP